MERPKYVLDSTAIINHLNDTVDINAFFNTLPAIPKADRFISGITFIEALSKPGMSEAELDEAADFLRTFVFIDVLEPEIKETAAALRRGRGLKIPDAIIAATAIILGATCLSGDEHLQKLSWPGYRVQAI
jgi:predicted nucleic acid-binding protein